MSNPGDETVLRSEEFKLAEILNPTSARDRMNETAMKVVELTLMRWIVGFDMIWVDAHARSIKICLNS